MFFKITSHNFYYKKASPLNKATYIDEFSHLCLYSNYPNKNQSEFEHYCNLDTKLREIVKILLRQKETSINN